MYVGISEASWSARSGLEFAYKRKGIRAVTTNRWVPDIVALPIGKALQAGDLSTIETLEVH